MRDFEIDILGQPWTVAYKTQDELQEVAEVEFGKTDGEHYGGMCMRTENAILIDKDSAQKGSTLLHEMIHAIADQLGLELLEVQVRGLETGLYQSLKQNKGLVGKILR